VLVAWALTRARGAAVRKVGAEVARRHALIVNARSMLSWRASMRLRVALLMTGNKVGGSSWVRHWFVVGSS
jgi:hypothetical protein